MTPIDLKSLRAGDRITVSTTYVVDSPADAEGDVSITPVSDTVGCWLWAFKEYVGSVERAPRDIEVGDVVALKGSSKKRRAEVVSLLDGDKVVMRYVSSGNYNIASLADLAHA